MAHTVTIESQATPPAQPSPAAERLAFSARVAVMSTVAFGALAFGAVEPWSILILQIGAALSFSLASISLLLAPQFRLRGKIVLASLAAMAALPAIQNVTGVSVIPYATWADFRLIVAYAMLAFAVLQTFRTEEHLESFALAASIFAAGLALLAIAQNFTSPFKLYWAFETSSRSRVFGPYVNPNHFAGFVEMLAPFPVLLAMRRHQITARRVLWAFLAIVIAMSVALSRSRSGMAVVAIQVVVCLVLLMRKRRRNVAAAGLLAAALAILLVGWTAGDQIATRAANTAQEFTSSIEPMRWSIVKDSLRMAAEKPFLGRGLGTFGDTYPRYRSFYSSAWVDYAHNDYVQLLVEAGIVGLAIFLVFIAGVLWRAWNNFHHWSSMPSRNVRVAALIGFCGLLLHSLTDFNLHIPANAALFFVLAAVASSGSRPKKNVS